MVPHWLLVKCEGDSRLYYMGLGPCNGCVRGSANELEKLSYITRLTEQIQPWISYQYKQWKNTHKTEYTEVFHTNEHDYESQCQSQRGTCNILQTPEKVIWLSNIYSTYDAACSTDITSTTCGQKNTMVILNCHSREYRNDCCALFCCGYILSFL